MTSPRVEDIDAGCPVGTESAEGPFAVRILVVGRHKGARLPPEVMGFVGAIDQHVNREQPTPPGIGHHPAFKSGKGTVMTARSVAAVGIRFSFLARGWIGDQNSIAPSLRSAPPPHPFIPPTW